MKDRKIIPEEVPQSGGIRRDGPQESSDSCLKGGSGENADRFSEGDPQDVLAKMTLIQLWQLFPIQLTPPQPQWAQWFQHEKERLEGVLTQEVAIHHIGSTAIRGIWAKPIIDLLVEAPPAELETVGRILKEQGYREMARSEGRIDFNKGYTPKGFARRVFHLHLRRFGDCEELYFCNHLNRHEDLAKDYEALKLALWQEYEFDRDGYTERKTEFVKKATAEAIRALKTENDPTDPRK